MGYCESMELAGATVHAFENFGSYQGDWWAKVTYRGVDGFVHGAFGSCSGCDSFQAEFDCEGHECGDDKYFTPAWNLDRLSESCEKCQDVKRRMAEFGESYLDGIMSYDEAIAKASENLEWDMDAKEMVEWLEKQGA